MPDWLFNRVLTSRIFPLLHVFYLNLYFAISLLAFHLRTMQPSIESKAAHLVHQVTWHWHSVLIGHLHHAGSDSHSHAIATVKTVCYSAVAVGLHLRDKGFLLFFTGPVEFCFIFWLGYRKRPRFPHPGASPALRHTVPVHFAECWWCCCPFLSKGNCASLNWAAAWKRGQRWRLGRGAADTNVGARTVDHRMSLQTDPPPAELGLKKRGRMKKRLL